MTLSTHAVAGALIGGIASQNLAFVVVAAFASHFLFDTVPHWDYALSSAHEDEANPLNTDMKIGGKRFFVDLSKIFFDFALGIVLTLIFFHSAPNSVLIAALVGALCAMAPDPLQFVYWKYRHEPLISLQKFHLFMHAKMHLKDKPFLGIVSQIIFISIIAVLIKFII
jgi:hypothetical protein